MYDIDKHKISLSLSVYDIFGYLVPGSTILSAILIFEIWASKIPGDVLEKNRDFYTPLLTAAKLLYNSFPPQNFVLSSLIVLIVIFIAYIAGHLVSSISSLLIDRILICKGYGYPYISLLKIPNTDTQTDEVSSSYYRGMFFWINFFLFVLFIKIFIFNKLLGTNIFIFKINILEIIFKGIIIVTFGKIFIGFEKAQKKSKIYKFSQIRLNKKINNFINFFITKIFVVIYDITATMLLKILNPNRSFDNYFLKKYYIYFKEEFGLDAHKAQTNNFWFAYLFLTENSIYLSALANSWLVLYSFARNLSTALYLSFLYTFCWLLFHKNIIVLWNNHLIAVLIIIPIALYILSFIMLIRYYYLYVCYFTKFIFRSFVFLMEEKRSAKLK